jgi:hypothetical protein
MKTEQQARNSRDNSDEKIVAVLEYFLSLHEADEIYNDIFNNKVEVSDIVEKLDLFRFTLNIEDL